MMHLLVPLQDCQPTGNDIVAMPTVCVAISLPGAIVPGELGFRWTSSQVDLGSREFGGWDFVRRC